MEKIDLACIIDDDPIFVFGAKRIMEMAHFCEDFLVYSNGREALDKLKVMIEAGEKIPDIILLDINMPILDGWGFLDEFTQIPIEKKITIYIITSSIDPADTQKVKYYEDVSNYIIMPITAEKLKKILSENTKD